MTPSVSKLVIIAPLMVASTVVGASEKHSSSSPFAFNSADLGSIQYTRSGTESLSLSAESGTSQSSQQSSGHSHQTEFSFKLKPGKLDFSNEGTYGLGLITGTRMEIDSRNSGVDGALSTISPLNQGLQYALCES